jgi:predicted peptidase
MVVVQCGGGLRLWEVETQDGILDNYGANIAFDTSATSWINNGYEDVIIVSVDNRNISDSDGSKTPYYRAADDINQTVEYFIDKYNVDTNRIYYSGNSQGSLIGYQTVGSRPDLWAAFMPCNGLSHFGDITTAEGLASYKQGIVDSMTPMAQAKIAMLWQLGRYDAGASGEKGQLFYDFMYDYYKKAGMTDDEINKILQLNIYEEDEYLKLGILTPSGTANFHGATKLVYTAHRDEFMPWLLSQSKAAENYLIEGVVSTKAITDSTVMGQKLSAVAVEYGKIVDASKLTKSSFTVKDRYYDLTFKDATITAVYTNDEPKMREDKTSVKGKYVIIETDAFDRVGYMGTTYIDPKTGVKEPYWLKPDVETTVRQNIDIIKDKDKEIISKADSKYMKMTEKTIQLKFEEFKTVTLKSNTNKDANGNSLDILSWYYLPEGYDKSDKKYPIVFVECGAGLRYWEKVNSLGETINNAGACIAFDQSATAWMNNKYEDVIIVSVNYRGTYAPAGYSAPQDVNQVAKYFIDNFNVDANRVYYSGNSAGSVLGYDTINDNPKLWAAFMPCNGIWVKTQEGANATMKAFAENDVAVIWQSGEDDKAATRAETEMYYDVTKQLFMDNGYSEEEAESMVEKRIWVKQDYYDAKILTDAGAYNPHLATKLAYTIDRDFFMPWILGQSK